MIEQYRLTQYSCSQTHRSYTIVRAHLLGQAWPTYKGHEVGKLYKNAFKCWKSVPKSLPITSLYPSTCWNYHASRWYQRQRHSRSHRTGRCLLTRTVADRVAQDTGQENYKQCSFHCYENGSGALARIMHLSRVECDYAGKTRDCRDLRRECSNHTHSNRIAPLRSVLSGNRES